jgi:heme o synthase
MSGAIAAGAPPIASGTWQDYLRLLKPRVVSLVVFTGAMGLALAPGHLHPVLAATAILCIAVAAGAAGALNMWYERELDGVMRRTRARPIPAGRIDPDDALAFGVTLAVASVLVMGLATNLLAAALLALSIAFYVLVYTVWLKPRTPQNIVIGGAAGAFPPIIGWAAVTGQVGLLPLLLFGLVFLWTPPHFWALSLYACQDYARAGIPMLPVVRGARHTRRLILAYTLALALVSILPVALGLAGWLYAATAVLASGGYVAASAWVLLDRQDEAGRSLTGDRPARFAFRYSLAYMAVLLLALGLDRAIG